MNAWASALLLSLTGVSLVCPVSSLAQSSTPKQPQSTTVCDLVSDPLRFSGTFVSVYGIITKWHHGLEVSDARCKQHALLLEWPDQVEPHPLFEVTRNDQYAKFEDALRTHEPGTIGSKGHIEATVQGRFDYVLSKDKNGKYVRSRQGFGHLNASSVRLIIQSVSNVKICP